MPTYIVTCKDGASPENVAAAKQHAKDQGGKITHEYNLIKGFAVEFPEDKISTMETHEHVKAVEADQEAQPHASDFSLDRAITELASKRQHSVSLADLVKHGRPPLSSAALFASANFTLELLPIRLAHRIQAMRNLPYIVVADVDVSAIYGNYLHSLSTLLPWQHRTISNLDDEIRFTSVLAELVATHQNTIETLANGFRRCQKYISPQDANRFLDTHLRTRIGTRLIAEQHIALHYSSDAHFDPRASPTPCPENPDYIGVIDTALSPARTVDDCAADVAEQCELQYGKRPEWVIDGEPETVFTFVPSHLSYIVTELLKNAFRATVENKSTKNREPVVITIAPEPSDTGPPSLTLDPPAAEKGAFRVDAIRPLDDNAPGVTIRIRDRGGGIAPDVVPKIWSYSFTTYNQFGDDGASDSGPYGANGGLGVLSANGMGHNNPIAGLGYGLPLSRSYAEYFGGGISVQSLFGWGTDVYLRLKGVGKIH
ncbi:branched-chain alpha-ketoacid dehydrogenase [Astrocystis sublimbata]|nr:branched-chain alpha-ketoacid dehydrogenase [Astrocystis sublimbata]